MNNRDRRVEVASIVGTHERNPTAPLTKRTLNATVAYFTGGYVIKPALIYTGLSPGRRDVRELVAVEVEKRVPGPMMEWFSRLDYGPEDVPSFNADELDALLEALDQAEDQRDFAGEYETLGNVGDVG